MDTMDEFEEFKAMAYNKNRRGSQSVPCTPHAPKRHVFNRESSKSERRRSKNNTTNRTQLSNGMSAPHLDEHTTNTNQVINNELENRLSKMTMVEIWQKRQRLQRQQSLGDPEFSPCQPECISQVTHAPLGLRHSDSDKAVMTYGQFTAKHGRSFSCRDRTRSKRFKEIDLEPMRPRTSSVPSRGHIRRPDTLALKNRIGQTSPREENTEFYLVRTFSTSKKGLINRGDSFKRRKTPIASNGCGPEEAGGDCLRATENLSHASSVGSLDSHSEPPIHRVMMLGSHGVGKSSLLQQFTSSDYMANLQRDSFQDSGK